MPSLRNIVIVRGEVFDGALRERIDTELRYLAQPRYLLLSSLGCAQSDRSAERLGYVEEKRN